MFDRVSIVILTQQYHSALVDVQVAKLMKEDWLIVEF